MTSLSQHNTSSLANGNSAMSAAPESNADWPAVLRGLIGPLAQLQEQHKSSLTTLDQLHTLLTQASAHGMAPASDRSSPAAASVSSRTDSAPVPPAAEQPQPATTASYSGSGSGSGAGEQSMTPPPGAAFSSSAAAAPSGTNTDADTDAGTGSGSGSGQVGGGATDFTPLLLSVIADVTGYPEDALTPDMSLEEELGVDSIKRVQILAIVRDQVPGLDDADGAEMARLRTIADVAVRLGELTGAANGQAS